MSCFAVLGMKYKEDSVRFSNTFCCNIARTNITITTALWMLPHCLMAITCYHHHRCGLWGPCSACLAVDLVRFRERNVVWVKINLQQWLMVWNRETSASTLKDRCFVSHPPPFVAFVTSPTVSVFTMATTCDLLTTFIDDNHPLVGYRCLTEPTMTDRQRPFSG